MSSHAQDVPIPAPRNGLAAEAHALLALANRLDRANRWDEARLAYETFLARVPDHAPAWADYAGLLLLMGHCDRAMFASQQALRLAPDLAPAKVNLARALMRLGHLEAAQEACRELLEVDPECPDTLLAWADLLMMKRDLSGARTVLERLLALAPAHGGARDRLHNIHIWQGDWAALRVEMEVKIQATTPLEADYERSLLRLRFGELPEAWGDFEKRLQIPGRILKSGAFARPKWGGEAFAGRTLLVHAEQGLGDTLMFLRYLPRVKALGGKVLLAVQPPLLSLAATAGGADEILPTGDPLPPFDLWITLMSLPGIFRTALPDIPADIPYLDVPSEVPHRAPLTATLALSEGLTRVGLVWAGNPLHPRDADRSLDPTLLEPLSCLPGVAWYGFQLQARPQPPLPGFTSLAPLLGTFADTAYALSGMDLVITVDTALAHLAGALGIPTLLLLPFEPDWRWLLQRDDSPWYPTLRLYRQPTPGDWGAVMPRVLADLGGTQEGL